MNCKRLLPFSVVESDDSFSVVKPGGQSMASRRGLADLANGTVPVIQHRDFAARGQRDGLLGRMRRIGFEVSGAVGELSVSLRARARILNLDFLRTASGGGIEQKKIRTSMINDPPAIAGSIACVEISVLGI